MGIREEDLYKNGFKKITIPLNNVIYNYADRFYQKKINEKTYLNVYYYDKFKENGAIDYDFEFELAEERERCWSKKIIYGIDKEMTLEDIQEEINK